jgi:hypothetical protein
MSVVTRAVAAFVVLSAAAIPVGALTIKNTSSKEVTVGVDTGAEEGVYKVPAGGSADVTHDCSSGCAVTGPWGYSRMVSQNDAIETDGAPLVTVAAKAPAQALVPQNPVAEPAEAAPAQAAAPIVAKRKPTAARKPPKHAAAKKGPMVGSFQMLFEGPKK